MILVDSNVLLDVITDDPTWCSWSSRALADAASTAGVAINPVTARGYRHTRKADEGTRTPDPIITSDVLYQLSYVGPSAPGGANGLEA